MFCVTVRDVCGQDLQQRTVAQDRKVAAMEEDAARLEAERDRLAAENRSQTRLVQELENSEREVSLRSRCWWTSDDRRHKSEDHGNRARASGL